jgi:hypothetical protein
MKSTEIRSTPARRLLYEYPVLAAAISEPSSFGHRRERIKARSERIRSWLYNITENVNRAIFDDGDHDLWLLQELSDGVRPTALTEPISATTHNDHQRRR